MRKDRAVSTTLSYTLTLAISALLVTGLIIAGGDYVDDRQEQVVRGELTVIGQQLVSDLAQVDRLAVAGSNPTTIRLNQSFPARVTGSSYRITLRPNGGNPEVELKSVDPEITVRVGFVNETSITQSTTNGGQVQVYYDSSGDELEVRNV